MSKFKKYFVLNAAYPINVGQEVELTEEQAKRRQHLTKNVKGDVYECASPFQFKGGEIFGFAGDINKKFASSVVDPETIEPAEPKEDEPGADPLAFLSDMSGRQLQYYARVKCDGLKLKLEQSAAEMIGDITAWHELKNEKGK